MGKEGTRERETRRREHLEAPLKGLRRPALGHVQILPLGGRCRALEVRFAIRRFARRDRKFGRQRSARSALSRRARHATTTLETRDGSEHETHLPGRRDAKETNAVRPLPVTNARGSGSGESGESRARERRGL